jgi:hypothetical protein
MSPEYIPILFPLFRLALSAVLDDPVSVDLPLKEHRLDVFESETIPDLHQTAEKILNCVRFPIPHFSFGHSKQSKVTWTQVKRIRWMRRAHEEFSIEFFLDFATSMALSVVNVHANIQP